MNNCKYTVEVSGISFPYQFEGIKTDLGVSLYNENIGEIAR